MSEVHSPLELVIKIREVNDLGLKTAYCTLELQ